MAITDTSSRLLPFAEELLENDYARENLREGAEKLRDAYGRTQKRRVKPSKDRKLRRQFEGAVAAFDEGTAALASGRKKPRKAGRMSHHSASSSVYLLAWSARRSSRSSGDWLTTKRRPVPSTASSCPPHFRQSHRHLAW